MKMNKNKIRECPKQDRCLYGFDCPYDYDPTFNFLCFEHKRATYYKKLFHDNYVPMEQKLKNKNKG